MKENFGDLARGVRISKQKSFISSFIVGGTRCVRPVVKRAQVRYNRFSGLHSRSAADRQRKFNDGGVEYVGSISVGNGR